MTGAGSARPNPREGDWNRRIWLLAGPIMLSNLSTPLLGAVDTAVVGHLPDPAYIGGVAIGAVIFDFLFWGFGFLRMGTTGFTAQAFGAGDRDELRAALARPLILAAVLGGFLIALQAPVGWLALWLFEASDQVEGFAREYYEIRIWSAPAALANYAMIGWLLGTGRARAVLLLQLALNGANIALDLLFVLGLGWGVAGVALASLVAECGATILGAVILVRILRVEGGSWDWRRIVSGPRIFALLRANLDILIRTLCLIAAFAYLTAHGATMGDIILAGNAILLQMQAFTAYGLDGFAHAAEVLAGNAYGARSRAAFRRVVKVSTLWAGGTALLMAGAYLVLGTSIIKLFTDLPEVREAALTYLPWTIVAPLVSVWGYQLDGIFIGTTRTAQMRNAMILSLVFFLAACWLLIPMFGNHGLWFAFTLFTAARAISLGFFYPSLERSVAPAGSSPGRSA